MYGERTFSSLSTEISLLISVGRTGQWMIHKTLFPRARRARRLADGREEELDSRTFVPETDQTSREED